jgi:MFS family permease
MNLIAGLQFLTIFPFSANYLCDKVSVSPSLQWPYLLVIPLAIIFGLITTLVLYFLNKSFALKQEEPTNDQLKKKRRKIVKTLSKINGIIELILYSFSILINIQLFIAFWLGVKTALKWDYEKRPGASSLPIRQISEEKDYTIIKFLYLRFLLGNAINIGLSYLIAIIVKQTIIKF